MVVLHDILRMRSSERLPFRKYARVCLGTVHRAVATKKLSKSFEFMIIYPTVRLSRNGSGKPKVRSIYPLSLTEAEPSALPNKFLAYVPANADEPSSM